MNRAISRLRNSGKPPWLRWLEGRGEDIDRKRCRKGHPKWLAQDRQRQAMGPIPGLLLGLMQRLSLLP